MKKILLLSGMLLMLFEVKAQIDPLYAQYLNNPLTINPAYTGLNNNFNASVSYRKQWAGFEGSPSTVNASTHTSLVNNKMGVGVMLIQDKIGANKNTEAYVTYAYKLMSDNRTFAFGLQAGVINYKSNSEDLNPFDKQDPAFSASQNFTKPSFGVGIILKAERYFLGVSVPRFLRNNVTINGVETALYEQHFYGTAAYVFYLSERVRFKPSVLLKGVKGSPISVDYNASFNLDEKYTVGIFARNLNTGGFLTQMRFAEAYRLAYVFEVPLNNSVGTRFTTHEISFSLNLAVFTFHTNSITNF